ncbi:Ig-like domain-containing protein, partial [Burkholderia ubonensis]|uniref:Ig-like domain-containing protein n=1 Tax=Burkholderia ubonensis TaxID=101571 RepID=UPI0018DFBEBE
MSTVKLAVVDGNTIKETLELRASKQGAAARVRAPQGGKFILADSQSGYAPENITVRRVGKHLHLNLEGTDYDQPVLIIEDFYAQDGMLVGLGEDGAYHQYIASDAEQDHAIALLADGEAAPQVLGAEQMAGFGSGLVAAPGVGGMGLGLGLLGLAGLGVLGGALASGLIGGGDDDGGNGGGGARPGQPTVDGVHDDVGNVTGQIDRGGRTDDKTPTFSGRGEKPGHKIEIWDNGKKIGETTVRDDGTWSFTPDSPLSDGAHNVTVIEYDEAGNASKPSDGFEFVIDTQAPGKAPIGDILDDVGAQQGSIPHGGRTDDTQPTLTGTGEPGARIDIYDNGVKIGEATVNPDGTWSFTPDTPLAAGEHSFTTIATDPAGNVGLPSDPYVVIVDNGAPAKPEISEIIDNKGPVTGPISDGGTTDDDQPTFGGIGKPGDRVTIIDNGQPIGEVVIGDDGKWEFTPGTPLPEGEHKLEIIVSDPDGSNPSEPSDPVTIIVDTTPPAKPGIGEIIDDHGPVTGPIGEGGTTDDDQPTLGGIGQPGDRVTIIDNGQPIGEVVIGDDGKWEFTPDTPLSEGEHNLEIIATDPAGNESEKSDPVKIIVDKTPPAAPEITSVIDDQGDRQGEIGAGERTDDARPVFTGTAAADAKEVIIIINGEEVARVPVENGAWTWEPSADLANGAYRVEVTAVDAAGNVSEASEAFEFEVLTGGTPPAPAITGITDDVGDQTGNIQPGGTTDDARPTVHGTAQPGSTVIIYADGVEVGRTTADAVTGVWNLELSNPLTDGMHHITAAAEDSAGNRGPETGEYPITVDTQAPDPATITSLWDDVNPNEGEITDGSTTNDNTPTMTGTAEPGSVVYIYDGTTLLGTAPVDADGIWEFASPTLADGAHSFHTVVEDAAGNRSAPTESIDFTVDTSDVIVSISHAIDNEGAERELANGAATNDSTPTLHGKATANGLVTIYLAGSATPLGTARADANGDWHFEVPALAEGTHRFEATVTPNVGGESDRTAPFELEIDLTDPIPPEI